MKQLSLLLLFSFFCLASDLRAQKLSSSELLDISAVSDFDFLGIYEDYLLLSLEQERSGVEIMAWDFELKELWKRELDFADFWVQIEAKLSYPEGFAIIYSYIERGQYILNLINYDAQGERLAEHKLHQGRHKASIDKEQILQSKNKMEAYLLLSFHSEDYLLLCINLPKGQVAWSQELLLEASAGMKQHYLWDMCIDELGYYYLFVENRSRKKRKKLRELQVYRLHTEGKELQSYPLPSEPWVDMRSSYDWANKSLNIVGLYSNAGYQSEGYFWWRRQADEPPLYKQVPFDEKLLWSMEGKQSKKREGIKHLHISDYLLRGDGGILVLAEQFYHAELQNSAALFGQYSDDYRYENILLFALYPDGRLHWSDIIFKSQYSQNDDGVYASFFTLRSNAGLRVLFNESTTSPSIVYSYELDPLGNLQRKRIELDEKPKLYPLWRHSLQSQANRLYSFSYHNYGLRLLRLDYE